MFIIITIFVSEGKILFVTNQVDGRTVKSITKIQNSLRVRVLLLYSSRVFKFGRCSLMHSASSAIRNWSLRVVEQRMDTSSAIGSVLIQLLKCAPTGELMFLCSASRVFRCRTVCPT